MTNKGRTTADVYSEKYYKTKYKKWIDGGITLKNPRIRIETEKKFNFIKRYMPEIKSALVPGCAFGMLVLLMIEKGIRSEGIDIAKYPLESVPAGVKPFIHHMDICDMSYKDDSFDLISAFDLMEHLYYEQILKAVKEMSRVACKYILIRVPVPYYNAEPGVADYSHYRVVDAGHVSVYTWDFWARRFTEAGKFEFWFATLWGRGIESNCETWITFRRK